MASTLFHTYLATDATLDELVAAHLELLDTSLARDRVAAERTLRSRLAEVYGVTRKLEHAKLP